MLDALGIERAVLAGASMGAHTAVRLALTRPERVAALALITPSFDPSLAARRRRPRPLGRARAGLREGGVEGFVRAYDLGAVPEAWRETVEKVLRQRLAAHEHPEAVADALEAVPRSRPFERHERARRDRCADRRRRQPRRGRPRAIRWPCAERYAQAIPGATLVVEEAGPPARSPIAWQGGQLSRVIAELAELAP